MTGGFGAFSADPTERGERPRRSGSQQLSLTHT